MLRGLDNDSAVRDEELTALEKRLREFLDEHEPAPFHPAECPAVLEAVATTLHKLSQHVADHVNRSRTVAVAGAPDQPTGPGGPGFSYLCGPSEVGEAIGREMGCAREEIVTAQPQGPCPAGVLGEVLSAPLALPTRRVRVRMLFQHSARFHEPTKLQVRDVGERDIEVRTLVELFGPLVIVDRATAFIPDTTDRTSAVKVVEPAVVGFLTDTFQRAWDRAESHPFLPTRAADAAREVIPPIRESILRLLIGGRSDKEIARRLGISQRSLQAHVAYLKEGLGAQHRLQLGYLVGRRERDLAPVAAAGPDRRTPPPS